MKLPSPIPPYEFTAAEWLLLIGAAVVGFLGTMFIFSTCL